MAGSCCRHCGQSIVWALLHRGSKAASRWTKLDAQLVDGRDPGAVLVVVTGVGDAETPVAWTLDALVAKTVRDTGWHPPRARTFVLDSYPAYRVHARTTPAPRAGTE